MDKTLELPPEVASGFGRRLHRLAVMFGCESWRAFDALIGTTPNHLLASAKMGVCKTKLLVALREKTGVNLNWLVAGDEEEVFSSPTQAQTEAFLRRTARRDRPPRKKS